MATNNRKGIGGRKPMIIPNPFVVYDEEWEEYVNLLWDTEDTALDIRIEDILVGCIRSIDSERPTTSRQAGINWCKLIRVYRNCNELTTHNIKTYLRCSDAQVKRYVKVIKLANIFLPRVINDPDRTAPTGYINVTHRQVHMKYLGNVK